MENGVTEGQGHTTMLSGGRFSGGIQKKRGADRTRTGTGQLGRKVNMKAKFIVAAQSKCTKRERRERAGDIRCTRILCGNSFPLCFVCGKVFLRRGGEGVLVWSPAVLGGWEIYVYDVRAGKMLLVCQSSLICSYCPHFFSSSYSILILIPIALSIWQGKR